MTMIFALSFVIVYDRARRKYAGLLIQRGSACILRNLGLRIQHNDK